MFFHFPLREKQQEAKSSNCKEIKGKWLNTNSPFLWQRSEDSWLRLEERPTDSWHVSSPLSQISSLTSHCDGLTPDNGAHHLSGGWKSETARTWASGQRCQWQLPCASIPGMWQTGETQVAAGHPFHSHTHIRVQTHVCTGRQDTTACWTSLSQQVQWQHGWENQTQNLLSACFFSTSAALLD